MNRFNIGVITVFLFVSLLVGCGSKQSGAGKKPKAFTPNMAVFYLPDDQVWDALLKTLKYDFLYGFDILDNRNRRFSTSVVRDYQPELQIKYRISGSLTFDGDGVVVVLYNQIQYRKNEAWVSKSSDFSVEKRILKKLRERLAN